jgi:molybdopterin/thiamine biosynthesis adenylyltransferase/rhodanese-related sulfurtransferase
MNRNLTDHLLSSIEVSPVVAHDLTASGAQVVDLRDANERQTGGLPGARAGQTDELIEFLTSQHDSPDAVTLVLCAKGIRSRTAVEKIRQAGFERVWSIAGGFGAWSDAGLPVNYEHGLDSAQAERYARHLVLPHVGAAGQRKLLDASVLLIGLGGLNSPASMYLAAAGVGTIGLVDDDRVERSNLQRQILHADDQIGRSKISSAQKRLSEINPAIKLQLIERRVEAHNANEIVAGWDVVIDGTDNFASRYYINDACVAAGTPLIYGAVMSFQGQVSVFWPAADRARRDFQTDATHRPCYRCLFPIEPQPGDAPNCSVAGVLGVLPGIVGTMQASEALKLVLGIGSPLIGRLLMFDALTMEFRETRVPSNPECEACS